MKSYSPIVGWTWTNESTRWKLYMPYSIYLWYGSKFHLWETSSPHTHTHTRSCQRFCRYPRSFLVNVHVGLKQHAAALILPMQCRYQQVLYLKEAACDSTWWFLVLLYQLFDGSVRTRPRVPTTPNHTHTHTCCRRFISTRPSFTHVSTDRGARGGHTVVWTHSFSINGWVGGV